MNLLEKLKQITGLVENGGDELLSKLEGVEMSEEDVAAPAAEPVAEAVEEPAVEEEGWTMEDKLDYLLNKQFEQEEIAAAKLEAKNRAEEEAKDKKIAELEARLASEAKAKEEAEATAKAKEEELATAKPDAIVHNPEAAVASEPQRAPGLAPHPNSLKSLDQTDQFFAHLVPGAVSVEEQNK